MNDDLRSATAPQRESEKFAHRRGRVPTVLELAAELDLEVEAVREAREALTARTSASLASPIKGDDHDDATLESRRPDEAAHRRGRRRRRGGLTPRLADAAGRVPAECRYARADGDRVTRGRRLERLTRRWPLLRWSDGSVARPVIPSRWSLREQHVHRRSRPSMPAALRPQPSLRMRSDEMERRPGERRPGQLLEISNAMVRLFKEQFGRGPTRARTLWAADDVLCVLLEETLTPAERSLAEMGEHQRLRDLRTFFQYASVQQFCEPVETITGRKVRAFLSAIDTVVDGLAVETFVLHPEGYEGPSRAELDRRTS
jgi:uncharacterized protein YbcI